MFFSGITVPVNPDSLNKIRVFPIRKEDEEAKIRTNFTYDLKMAIPENFRPKEKKKRRNFMLGYMGECYLRDLHYFDVGKSFLFDTLHNMYRGTLVSVPHNTMFVDHGSVSFNYFAIEISFFLLKLVDFFLLIFAIY